MNWLIATLRSSIGKKLMMAVTGLSFLVFLAAHLAGNMTVFVSPQTFNSYAETLTGLGPIIKVLEIGLATFALIHILTGLTLFYQNLKARPVRYRTNKSAGGRTIGSATMPYTGVILLVFLIIHLANFTFADKTGTTLFELVSSTFEKPAYFIFYIASMMILAIHISHGFWSAFQTLGANHPKYTPAIWVLSIVLALAAGIGFGILPIYFSISA